jgi:DNA repair exonuclease SbcCD nuclease subunit
VKPPPRPEHRVRLVHTSDLHIGMRASTPGPSPLEAVAALAPAAERAQADAVLIAGDFFDHRKVDEAIVAHAADALAKIPIPVVILPGNHDPYRPESPWVRCAARFPANVRVIASAEGELVVLDELGVQVWGQAHTHFEDFPPAAALPRWLERDGAADWRVAMAHGIHAVNGYQRRFSYQIEIEDLVNLGAHYVALGHIDEHRRVGGEDVIAYYPSSPIRSGTFALVELAPDGIAVSEIDARA